MKRACKDCEFCDLKAYECHRHPPVFSTNGELADGWPAVMADDWCGEFQPREGLSGQVDACGHVLLKKEQEP